jgi:hypothetical protein
MTYPPFRTSDSQGKSPKNSLQKTRTSDSLKTLFPPLLCRGNPHRKPTKNLYPQLFISLWIDIHPVRKFIPFFGFHE